LYELHYELNNRLDWLRIPLQGVQQLVHVPMCLLEQAPTSNGSSAS
jgi:predicted trehalose synthase